MQTPTCLQKPSEQQQQRQTEAGPASCRTQQQKQQETRARAAQQEYQPCPDSAAPQLPSRPPLSPGQHPASCLPGCCPASSQAPQAHSMPQVLPWLQPLLPLQVRPGQVRPSRCVRPTPASRCPPRRLLQMHGPPSAHWAASQKGRQGHLHPPPSRGNRLPGTGRWTRLSGACTRTHRQHLLGTTAGLRCPWPKAWWARRCAADPHAPQARAWGRSPRQSPGLG